MGQQDAIHAVQAAIEFGRQFNALIEKWTSEAKRERARGRRLVPTRNPIHLSHYLSIAARKRLGRTSPAVPRMTKSTRESRGVELGFTEVDPGFRTRR